MDDRLSEFLEEDFPILREGYRMDDEKAFLVFDLSFIVIEKLYILTVACFIEIEEVILIDELIFIFLVDIFIREIDRRGEFYEHISWSCLDGSLDSRFPVQHLFELRLI